MLRVWHELLGTERWEMSNYTVMEPVLIEGRTTFPMSSEIAVGFGDASLTRDGTVIWRENYYKQAEADILTGGKAEEMASKDPDHNWCIHIVGPLTENHYQRQGEKNWVLYFHGLGFA